MKLSHKFIFIIFLLSVLIISATIFLLNTTVKKEYINLEKRDITNKLEQAQGTIINLENTIEQKTLDWSYWDDTYQFVLNKNEEYIEANLNKDTLVNLQINLMAFFNKNNELIYALFLNENNELINLNSEIKTKFDNKILTQDNIYNPNTGIIDFAGKEIIFSSQAILQTNGSGPKAGTLVFGKILYEKDWEYLQSIAKLNFKFTNETLNSSIIPLNKTIIYGYKTIENFHNTKNYTLKLESKREIINLSKSIFKNLVILFLIIFITTTIILIILINYLLINNIIIKRLHMINEQIKSRNNTKNKTIKIPGNDEINQLTNNINTYLKSIDTLNNNLKDANTKITNLLKANNEFLIQISHDLKTPLTPIKNLTKLTLKDKKLSSKSKQNLTIINRNVESLEYLTNDILNILNLESKNYKPKQENITIEELLNFKIKELKITKNIPSKIPKIKGDFETLKNAIQIISKNAKIFNKSRNKSLNITVKKIKNNIQFEFKDNGIGLDKENINKIFTEFFKVEQYQGGKTTGLGLPIAKRIIEKQKGKIYAKSKGIGKGTTIIFTLPIK